MASVPLRPFSLWHVAPGCSGTELPQPATLVDFTGQKQTLEKKEQHSREEEPYKERANGSRECVPYLAFVNTI